MLTSFGTSHRPVFRGGTRQLIGCDFVASTYTQYAFDDRCTVVTRLSDVFDDSEVLIVDNH